MPQTLGTDRPSIAVRAVTAWDGGQGTVFDPDTLAVRQGPERAFDALRRDAPVWIDMDLESRSTTDWLGPWDAPAAGIVDWSDLRGLASRLGFPLPCSAESDDPVAVALERLPTLNELAVLRWLGQRLDPLDMDYAFAPLVGCIPTFQLTD